MKKKILFFIHDLGHGGAEKVLVNLVNNMNFSKFDITVMAIFGGGVNEQFLSPKVKYKAVFHKMIPGNSKIMKIFSPNQLHRFFVKEHYDVEISYLEGPSARIISGCTDENTYLVSWIHVEQHTKKMAAQSFRSYSESVECYSRFHKNVCVSKTVKKDFMNIYPMLNNVDVLYNTNETNKILDMKDEPIEANVFQNGEIRLCGVGKIVSVKGFDKLARIHKRLRLEGYLVHTYVLGEGAEQKRIEKYIVDNGLKDSFTFLGYQINPYKYIARCDLFICASIAEGFSTAVTEALIVGTPVITTPVSGMEEMLGKDNEYGIITEMSEESLYENIKRLLDEPQLLEFYRCQARIRGKIFSKESTVKAVEDYLEKMLGENRDNAKN